MVKIWFKFNKFETDNMQITDRKIIVGLVILQILVCLPFINSFPIALDEPFSIFNAQQDLRDLIPEINKGNNSPFHFILLHFWIKLFGISPIAVRSLSLLFSVLTIPVLYSLGKKMSNNVFGVMIVLIFIFSRFEHYHAMEARMYALFTFLFALIIYDVYLIIFEKKSRFVTLVIWNICLFYTHYLSLFVFVTELLILILYFKKIKTFKKALLRSIFIQMIAFLPGVLVFLKRTQNMNETWVAKPKLTELYGNIFRFFNNTLTFFICITIIVLLIFVLKKYKSVNLKNTFENSSFKFILLFFVVPYIGMFIVSVTFQPVFLDRYLLFTTIPLYLTFGVFAYLVLNPLKWYFAVLIILPMTISTKYVPQTNRDVVGIANFAREEKTVETLIYLCPPWIDLQFYYHYDQSLFKNYLSVLQDETNDIMTIYGLEEVDLSRDIILLNSKEGYIKEGQPIVDFFASTHVLERDTVLNDLYQLYSFKLKK